MIDKAFGRGPRFPLENTSPLMYAIMRAAHFLIILRFSAMSTVTLFPPTVWSPHLSPSLNIPFIKCLKSSSCYALGRRIKCWIHFLMSFIYSFVQSTPYWAGWVCVLVGWHTQGRQGTLGRPGNSCSWRGGFSQSGRRKCPLQVVCVWMVSNLTTKRPSGCPNIFTWLFLLRKCT